MVKKRHGGRRTGAGRKPKISVPILLEPVDRSGDHGKLSVLDDLPFRAKRAFVIHGVPENCERGRHAHRKCHQILFCAHGTFDLNVTEINTGGAVVSNWTMRIGRWMLIPAMHWMVLDNFSRNAVCLVLASEKYRESDVIRDWDEFRKLSFRRTRK